MGSGEQQGSGGRDGWPIASMVGAAVGGLLALSLQPFIQLPLWAGTLAFVAFLMAGIVLGRFVGSLLLRRKS